MSRANRILRRVAVPAAALLLLVPAAARAQGTLLGTVVADSGGKPVGGAVIRIPSLSRGARTNWTGDFVIDGLAAGTYEAVAQAPGFAPFSVQVTIPASGSITQTFRLSRGAAAAPAASAGASGGAVATAGSAAGGAVTMSARMEAFEKRRSEGKGTYLGPADLGKSNTRLADALRPILRGVRFQQMQDGSLKLISTRDAGENLLGQRRLCFVQVFVDGSPVTGGSSAQGGGAMAPRSTGSMSMKQGPQELQGDDLGLDFNPLATSTYEAVEFYADPSSTPPEYRRDGGRCGTLLLWTRVQ